MPPGPSSSEEVVARFDELLQLMPDANRRMSFGYPSATIGGNMFFSLFRDDAILRLPEAERQRLAQGRGIETFSPIPGRPMTGFMVLPPDLFLAAAAESWVEAAADHARRMPPKPVKGRKSP